MSLFYHLSKQIKAISFLQFFGSNQGGNQDGQGRDTGNIGTQDTGRKQTKQNKSTTQHNIEN